MLLGIRARAVVEDGARREVACCNVLTSFDFSIIADAIVVAVFATVQGHHLGADFKLNAGAKIVVVGIEFGQHFAACGGEHHGTSHVAVAIATKINGAKAIASRVFELQEVTALRDAHFVHQVGRTILIVAVLCKDFTIGGFNAPAGFTGKLIGLQFECPTVRCHDVKVVVVNVVVCKVIVIAAQQGHLQSQ